LSLGDVIVRLRLDGMHYSLSEEALKMRVGDLTEIRELDRLLDEENWYVVSNNVPVTFFRIELDSKPADVSDCIGTAAAALDGGKSQEDRGLPRGVGQHRRKCNILCAFEEGEFAESSSSSSVDNSLRNTLMIEAMNLETRLVYRDGDKAVAFTFSLAC
jgi:hypothetical protein